MQFFKVVVNQLAKFHLLADRDAVPYQFDVLDGRTAGDYHLAHDLVGEAD